MSQLKGACIIGQSGGPTSVINASAYGAIKTALESDSITRVLGALNGIKGVLDDNLIFIEIFITNFSYPINLKQSVSKFKI